jgi:hypothetical protein
MRRLKAHINISKIGHQSVNASQSFLAMLFGNDMNFASGHKRSDVRFTLETGH